jgi:hypothetical protein
MKLGILSDVHDHVWNLRAALANLQHVDALLVAGDLCSPFVLPILAEGYGRGRIHVVFGNNDGDRFRMAGVAGAWDHLELHGEAFEGRFAGRSLVMNHFPALAGPMDDGRYDVIVYGHDHRFHVGREAGRGWRLNPGTLLGYDPLAGADVPPTFLVLDLEADRVDGFALEADGGGSLRAVPFGG